MSALLLKKNKSTDYYTKIPKWHVYFEREEDLVAYLLTFDEAPESVTTDAAAYYAPYIPLIMTGTANASLTVTTFITPYGKTVVGGSESN